MVVFEGLEEDLDLRLQNLYSDAPSTTDDSMKITTPKKKGHVI